MFLLSPRTALIFATISLAAAGLTAGQELTVHAVGITPQGPAETAFQGFVPIDFAPSPIGTAVEEPMVDEGCWVVCITFIGGDCSTPLAGIIDFTGPSFPFALIDVQVVTGLTCSGTPTTLPVAVEDGQAVALRFEYIPQVVATTFDTALFNNSILFSLAGGTLAIDSVEIEQPRFSDQMPVPVGAKTDVVDETPVTFKIDIVNTSFVDVFATVDIVDPETDEPLPGGPQPSGILPGQTLALAEFVWDTTGFAWDGDMPRTDQDIEIAIPFDTETDFDLTTETVGLQPNPVIMVHGFRSDEDTWDGFETYFQGLHPNWNAFAVDTLDTGGLFSGAESYAENARRLNTYVSTQAASVNAWQIDLLAHSMGGLISRQYIHSRMPKVALLGNKPLADQLLMMGTPHLGTTCADKWGRGGVPLLRPGYLAGFNTRVTKTKGVAFSALAGNPFDEFWCDDTMVDNDGWVTVPSATAKSSDNTLMPVEHTEMTDETETDVTNYIAAKLVPGSPFAEPERIPEQPLAGTDFDNQLIHAETLTIGVGEMVTTPFSVPSLSQMTVWFPYDSQLDAVLRDPGGSPTGTFQSGIWVARIEQQNPTPGTWSLELTNNTGESGDFPVSVWVEGYPYLAVLEITEIQAATFQMTATLTNDGSPVTGATMQAELSSFPVSDPILVDFFDDGLHDDGAAGDGVYGATAGPLPDLGVLTGYGILLHSSGPGFELFTVADLVVAPDLFVDGFETGDTSNWDQSSPAPANLGGGDETGGFRVLRSLRSPAIY